MHGYINILNQIKMKLAVLCMFLAIVCSVNSIQQLRRHDLPFLDSMNPLQMAQLMSGDYVSILPSFIQPLARKILGQEKQSGVSGFLSQAQNMLSGNTGASGGLLGGMGDLFKSAGNSGSGNGVLSQFSNAFGGNTAGITNGLTNGGSSGGVLNGLTNLFK